MDKSAIIYLSDRRLCEQSPVFRCYQTPIEAEPFLRFEDNTLAAQQAVDGQFDRNRMIVFLPLVGAVEVNDRLIETGQVLHLFVEKGETITVQNPYESESINYLEIHTGTSQISDNKAVVVNFDLTNKNQLLHLPDLQPDMTYYIGKYDGRKDDISSFNEPTNVFVFIINGAFEVQNRLLESRDGLLLYGISDIDFEALSNEAIIMMFQV